MHACITCVGATIFHLPHEYTSKSNDNMTTTPWRHAAITRRHHSLTLLLPTSQTTYTQNVLCIIQYKIKYTSLSTTDDYPQQHNDDDDGFSNKENVWKHYDGKLNGEVLLDNKTTVCRQRSTVDMIIQLFTAFFLACLRSACLRLQYGT